MLTENQVIESVKKHLINELEYDKNKIETVDTYSKGYDIIAEKNGQKLIIEAKGQTSSKKSNRKGQEFTHAQKKTHVAMAMYKTMQTLEKEKNCKVGIAFPNDTAHMGIIHRIKPSLDKLNIEIFLVSQEGKVE